MLKNIAIGTKFKFLWLNKFVNYRNKLVFFLWRDIEAGTYDF